MATRGARLGVLTAATMLAVLSGAGTADAAGNGHGKPSGKASHHTSSSHGKRTAPGQVKHRASRTSSVRQSSAPATSTPPPTAPVLQRVTSYVASHATTHSTAPTAGTAASVSAPASAAATRSAAVTRPSAPVSRPTVTSLGNLPAAARAFQKNISMPVGMFALLFLFLFLQNKIDRHDPKIRVTEASSTDTLPFHLPRGARPVARRAVPVRTGLAVAVPAPTCIRLPA